MLMVCWDDWRRLQASAEDREEYEMINSDENRRRDALREILLDDVKGRIDIKERCRAETADATTLVLNDPYAFLIASCLDRG